MQSRPATRDDIAATAGLSARSETFWFGAPELNEDEIAEYFDQVGSFEADSRVFFDGERLLAVALHNPTDAWFVIDPELAHLVAPELIEWYSSFENPHMDVLDRDEAMRTALERRGWRHRRSMFDLVRPVTSDWSIAEPAWPPGITVRDFSVDDARAMYDLVYLEANWSDVPGHPHRDFAAWRSLFLTDTTDAHQQVLAFRGERLVGVSIGRIFSDKTGWIAQLAVATTEQGNGIGRALLLESLHRRCAAGATALGLGVQADNRNALGLYLSVGLTVDREWMEYHLA